MIALVPAGVFVYAEVDGQLMVDARSRTLLLHASTFPVAGETSTIAGARYVVAEVVREPAEIPLVRLRSP